MLIPFVHCALNPAGQGLPIAQPPHGHPPHLFHDCTEHRPILPLSICRPCSASEKPRCHGGRREKSRGDRAQRSRIRGGLLADRTNLLTPAGYPFRVRVRYRGSGRARPRAVGLLQQTDSALGCNGSTVMAASSPRPTPSSKCSPPTRHPRRRHRDGCNPHPFISNSVLHGKVVVRLSPLPRNLPPSAPPAVPLVCLLYSTVATQSASKPWPPNPTCA